MFSICRKADRPLIDYHIWMPIGLPSAAARVAALVVVGALCACGAPKASAPAATSSPPASPPGATTTLQLCQAEFSDDEVLSWASGTVTQFREYQYGGPNPTRPLAGAFADLPGDTRGAWCGLRGGVDTINWWAVVEGRQPVKAIDITGPGEGTMRGEAQGPPVVP
jgi:hypothetical protein